MEDKPNIRPVKDYALAADRFPGHEFPGHPLASRQE